MKIKGKYVLSLLLSFSLVTIGCGGDDDATGQSTSNITISDENIGVGQVIELTCDYKSENPNILVTWYDGDEKLNSEPRTDLTFSWQPKTIGDRIIKAVITDRDDIITCQKQVTVKHCDLAYGFIGDAKSKILRKYSNANDDGSCINYGRNYNPDSNVWYGQKYYYSNNKIDRIELYTGDYSYSGAFTYDSVLRSQANRFISGYNYLKSIYGPAYSGITSVPSNTSGDEFSKFAQTGNFHSVFRSDTGQDIKLVCQNDYEAGGIWWYRIVAYVGNANKGLGE